MQRIWLAVMLSAALCCGCVSVQNSKTLVPPSALFSEFSAPLTPITEPVPCTNLKSGTASQNLYVWTWPILPFISASDCDMMMKSAMEDGGITKVYYADYSQDSFLGIVTKFTVTVYGE